MKRSFWEFRSAAETGSAGVGELLLYGNIGPGDGMEWLFDEIGPKQFRDDLDALGDISELRVMINSQGGDVFGGQAIYSILKRYKAHVSVYIDGLAASIASLVAMAGDDVYMPANAMMMVHDPYTVAMGNAGELRKIADTLDQIRESMVAAYIDKTGLSRRRLIGLLDAETWMTADEAVELGFADHVEDSKKIAASVVRPKVININNQTFDLASYRNVPEQWQRQSDSRDADGTVALSSPTIRDAEGALRDVGLSRQEAKAILAKGWQRREVDARQPRGPAGDPAEDLQTLYLAAQHTLRRVGGD